MLAISLGGQKTRNLREIRRGNEGIQIPIGPHGEIIEEVAGQNSSPQAFGKWLADLRKVSKRIKVTG